MASDAVSAVIEARRVAIGQSIDYRATLSDVGQQILRDAPAEEHSRLCTPDSADPKPWQWELSDVGLKLIASAKESAVPDREKSLLDGLLRDGVRRVMSPFQREVDASEQVRALALMQCTQERRNPASALTPCATVTGLLLLLQGSPEAELTLVFLIEKALGHSRTSRSRPTCKWDALSLA